MRHLVDARGRYFTSQRQHLTCGAPVAWRVGNPPSANEWGGDAMPPPPPPTDKELGRGFVMAPVPYDVPQARRSPSHPSAE